MEFSFPSNLSGDFNLLKKLSKKSFHNKLNRKQLPLWSCFAFITGNIDQNTATKSLCAHKTAENSHTWKSPYNALQAQYWINVPHACQWIASLLIPYRFKLQNGYFDNKYLWDWSDECCWHYIYNWINIIVGEPRPRNERFVHPSPQKRFDSGSLLFDNSWIRPDSS